MKKHILIIILLAINAQLYSQTNMENVQHVPMASTIENNDITTPSVMGGEEALWSEDFSDETIPNVITEDMTGDGDWRWSNEEPQGMWTSGGLFTMPTGSNGFMMMEADFYNSPPQNGEEDEMTSNPIHATFSIGPIDLSSSETEQLVLQFHSEYRICCSPPGDGGNDLNVYISTDGGEIFSDLNYIEGDTYEGNERTYTISQIQLGDFSANIDSIYFKFEWIGTHYYWMIDDISVIERPAYDLQMKSAWLTMEDEEFIEYYITPKNQMADQMLIGAEVYNYGYNDETDANLNGSITSTGLGGSIDYILESDSTAGIETDYFDVSSLEIGTYTFTASISSSGDDSNMDDNMLEREFVISDKTYSLAGLYESSDRWGTGWPGGAASSDGVKIANYFDITETTTLSSITVDLYLDELNTSLGVFQTTSGGEMIAYVCDTTGLLDPLVTELDPDFGGILWTSDFILVSEQDVNDGRVVINVDEFELTPNAYFIVIELYSNGNESDIIILDDTSVPQPWYASLLFNIDEGAWGNWPNAAAIGIGLDGFENTLSEETLEGIHCFPNPAKDYLEIKTDKILSGTSYINLFNILGENVKSYEYHNFGQSLQVDLNSLSSGSYILEFENDNKISRHKLIVE
jgi:hypothetical protein